MRVIAATNQNLAEEVHARRFRQDLFYRLSVFPLELPPLRARKEDIPELAQHCIAKTSKHHRVPAPPLTPDDIDQLLRYDWPGNIRELQNVLERAVILSKGVRLRLDVALPRPEHHVEQRVEARTEHAPSDLPADVVLTDRECRDRERANVMKALERTDGRIYGRGGAAELLGLNPTTLASRLRALKIAVTRAQPTHAR